MIFTLCHLKHLSSTDFEVLKPCQKCNCPNSLIQ